MKIILSQVAYEEGDKWPHPFSKEFNHTVIPQVGNIISDSLWKDPYEYEVVEVNINYQQDECYIGLKPLEYKVPDIKEYASMAKLHGWRLPLDKD